MSDREKAQRGPETPPEPHVVDPDEVVLNGAEDGSGTGPSAAEPELSVSADELILAEPELAPAVISEDAAGTVALDETAEETRAAAEEAAQAAVLAAGPLPANAPAAQAAPSGTAPAGGHAGDTAGATARPLPVLRAGGGPGVDAGTDPAAVGAGPAAPGEGSGPGERTGSSAVSPKARKTLPPPAAGAPASAADAVPAGESAVPAGEPWAPTGDAAPAGGPRRARPRERQETKPRRLVPLLLGAVVVLALLIWGIISLVRGISASADPGTVPIPTAAGADGVIAEDVAPSALTAGQCLLDFTGISNEVTIVTCTTPHRAQLIAAEFYPDEAEFPGRDQLGARAKAACDAAEINTDAAAGAGRIELLHVTPTERTWADDDRRVDCFAVVEEGATLSRSLLNE